MKRVLQSFCLVVFTLAAFVQINAQSPCDRLSKIKIMPFHDERVDDPAYYSLIDAGESALPCLIGKVTNTRRMHDPRQAPGYAGIEVKVGDVAYFMIVRIAKIGFIEMLPPKVQDRYKTDGVFAYFVFVLKPQNRVWLRRNLNRWYRTRSGESARTR